MAPSKEEERQLKEHKDDSPTKLGLAETFLKAVLDVPFAFKRIEVMLYIGNFESEVEYLKTSFQTLVVISHTYAFIHLLMIIFDSVKVMIDVVRASIFYIRFVQNFECYEHEKLFHFFSLTLGRKFFFNISM